MHCEDVNVQKKPKGRAELIIPRYHELLAQQEEKKASMSKKNNNLAELWLQ